MIRKQIYIEENMIEKIKEIARNNNISQSEVIRRSIREFIKQEQLKGEVKDPLLQLIGLGESDVTDGSANHDNYLYGAGKDE